MTLPGAETIKGGIMGEDCFRTIFGAPLVAGTGAAGIVGESWMGEASMGERSGD